MMYTLLVFAQHVVTSATDLTTVDHCAQYKCFIVLYNY